MDRQPTLDGECLLLRPLLEEDWQALYAVAADPQIWSQHPQHDRWREDIFRAFFDDALAKGGAIAVIDKVSGAVVGSSRWERLDQAGGGSVEIGWTFLARSHWGGACNRELKRLMLEKSRIFPDEGFIFGPEGDGFERINIACPRSILREALTRIRRAVDVQ